MIIFSGKLLLRIKHHDAILQPFRVTVSLYPKTEYKRGIDTDYPDAPQVQLNLYQALF